MNQSGNDFYGNGQQFGSVMNQSATAQALGSNNPNEVPF
jgi:hypothetical protein